jgi:hypothetical protein
MVLCLDIEQQLQVKLGGVWSSSSQLLHVLPHDSGLSGSDSRHSQQLHHTVPGSAVLASPANLSVLLQTCAQLSRERGALPVIVIAAETRADLLCYEEYVMHSSVLRAHSNPNSLCMYIEPLQSLCRVYKSPTASFISCTHLCSQLHFVM